MSNKRPNQPGPPKRVPSTPVPPTARKEAIPLQPGPAGSSTKFYNGPTVSKTGGIPDYSRDVAKQTVTSAKVQTRKAVAVARRHPWSIASLITSLPLFVFISLFSTVVCPPLESQSTISKYVLSPLGLSHPPQAGSLHQSLCYPANAYHDAVLEPYIYPLIDRAQERVTTHPAYVKGVEPAYTRARDTSTKVWNGPIAPVVRKVQRQVKRAYLTFVQPHIPFVKAKIHTITAPYTSRAAALHKQYLHPQIAAAQLYANSAKDQSVKSYKYIASHPVSGQAGKYANLGYQAGKKRSTEAYNFSRPHVIRGAKEAERIAREILGPRVVKGLEIGGQHAARAYSVVKSRVVALYHAHLDPHVGPHIRRASTTLAPHAETFNQKVYRPYIRPSLEAILPAFIFTPEPPKTFWAMIADFLPSAGTHAAERKGSMDQGYSRAKADVKTKTASVKSAVSAASSASASPSYSAKAKAGSKKDKMTRAEMDKTRENLKERIEEQGKKGYKQVKSELVALNRDILNTKFPMLQQGSRAEIEQDINYVVTGLDKLYSKSPVLKKDQVLKSSQQADIKLQSKVQKIKSKLESLKSDWHEQGRPIVRKAFQPLDAILAEKEVLAEDMAWVDDVSPKDWTKFNALQASADGWKDKYMGLHNGTVRDKALQDPSANVDKNLADLFTEIDDVVEGFRARVGILKRTALDRVEAREALASESSSTASRSASLSPSPVAAASASDRVSILPIAERAAEAIGAAGIIEKGKQQVEDALRQAGHAVTASPSSASASASGSVSILPIAERAAEAIGAAGIIGKGKQQVEDALRQAAQAVTASPSPASAAAAASDRVSILPIAERAAEAIGAAGIIGKGKQQVEDALHQASQAIAGSTPSATGAVQQVRSVAEDLVSSASSVVHDATRSAVSAAGYTPSPEGVSEHAASVYNDASASIASVVSAIPNAAGAEAYLESIAAQVQAGAAAAYAQAQDGAYHASRSIVSAAGGTPSPDNAGGYAASLADQASSVGQAVSSAVHEATRSIISAAGGTPSPEGIAEYASAASASASSVVAEATRAIANAIPSIDLSAASASASSVGSVVSQAVHDGTRAAVRAVGATPSPESAGEHLESVYAEASKSASSLGDVVASAVHDGTRSVVKAVGATPSPESVNEHLESVYAQAASSASSVGSVAAVSASSVGSAVSAIPSAAAQAANSLWTGFAPDASSLSSRISSLLAPTATPTGVASYLSSLSSAGASVGQGMLASGQEILESLSSEMHTATRSLVKAAGGTAAPEGLGEKVEDIWRKVEKMEGKVEEGVKKALGRDEL